MARKSMRATKGEKLHDVGGGGAAILAGCGDDIPRLRKQMRRLCAQVPEGAVQDPELKPRASAF